MKYFTATVQCHSDFSSPSKYLNTLKSVDYVFSESEIEKATTSIKLEDRIEFGTLLMSLINEASRK